MEFSKLNIGFRLIPAVVAVAVLSGCDNSDTAAKPAPAAPAAATPAAALPTDLFAAAAPAGAKPVGAAKPTAKKGEKIVLTGRIGGSSEPFVPSRAVLTLVDPGLKSCAAMGDKDHCATPWDYCCEPQESLSKNTATVQVIGPDGAPLKIGLSNAGGLKPLAEITVAGTIAEADGKNLLIVNAEQIFVGK